MCSVTYRSSPTTAPRLRTTLASLSIRIELHYAVHLAAGYPLYGLKIQPPPFTRPSALASHLNMRGDHLLVSRHKPCVSYFQPMDPMGTGRRPPDPHTSFDGAKRLGSGNPTSIPPFVPVFPCSAQNGFEFDVE